MQERNTQPEGLVAGRNPVIELLKSGESVDRVLMQKGDRSGQNMGKIIALAKERGVPVKEVAKEKLDALCEGINHQGVAAFAAAERYSTVEEIEALAAERGEPLFVVICDGIEDPHNLGAIIRTADAAGAHGVIIPRRHGVGLTPAAVKSSAGAAQHVPVARVANLASAVEDLKRKNVWVYAADMGGENWCSVNYDGAVALIVGSEGEGVSRLLREKSDVIVGLPMYGKVNSLNASVASALVLYEVSRQRHGLKARN